MTDAEFDTLPTDVRKRIEEVERLAKELLLDLGPLRASDLMQCIATNLSNSRITV